MKKLSSRQKKFWFSLIIFLGGAAVFVQGFLPGILEERYLQNKYAEARLQEKTVMVNQGSFRYLEGGNGPTILFIHGFQGDKSYWTSYAKELVDRYHIIALDLPAHGKTTYDLQGNYDLYSLAKSVEVFCESLGLKDFHLAGVSMGGGVSIIVANDHPKWVRSLSLLNPLAVEPEQMSIAQQEIARGLNPFFPKNLEELEHLYALLINRYLGWSSFAKKHMLSSMMKKWKVYETCFQQFMVNLPLDHILERIRARTLILIGEEDRVIHPSSGKVIHRLIPHSELVILKKGPHTFLGSNFDQAIHHMKEFFLENDPKP